MAVRRVKYTEYDPLLQMFVERPLDDADRWTLELANQINGNDLTDEQFQLVMSLFKGELAPGG